jgi:hypothetical protein
MSAQWSLGGKRTSREQPNSVANDPGTDIRMCLAFMRDARGGSGSSRGQGRGPQITLPCRMSLTSSGEQPSHSP